jgi:Surface antigen variable number repeat
MKLALFPVLFAVGMSSMAQAQSSINRPKVVIDAIELKGTLLPEAVQERLVTSLKQHEYEEDSDWVKDLEVRVVRAESEGWPDRENQGYLGFSVSAEWKPLRREQGMLHVLVTVCVNEGQQKRLDKIEFRYVKEQSVPPVFNSNDLRKLIPLEDGEIYNRDKYWAGLSAIERAYNERGFIDFNIMQTMQLDDVNQTVSLVMDLNEGPQYRWGNVQVIGLDRNLETILRSRMTVGSPASPKLIRDFYQEYKSLLPVGASPETVKWQSDAKRAIVDLTFDFSTPPSPPVHDKGLCQ